MALVRMTLMFWYCPGCSRRKQAAAAETHNTEVLAGSQSTEEAAMGNPSDTRADGSGCQFLLC